MKKIKVYLQYPWKFPDSPYYKYLIDNPPEGIVYLNAENQKGVITSGAKFSALNKIKTILRNFLGITKIPNFTFSPKRDYDMIHCAHCLSLNKKPWVVDLEHYWNFSSSGEVAYSKIGKERIKKALKSPYCRKILPWTESAKRSIIEALNDKDINKKIEVVHPAIPAKTNKRITGEKIVFLFIGRYFYQKGGAEVIEVFDRLTAKYPNIECIFVSEIPKEYARKCSSNKKIKFYSLMPQEKLFELYSKSDVFIYPGYSDTFGFALIEAMSFGLPVITVDGFAKRDIIKEGKTGFVIKRPEMEWGGKLLLIKNREQFLGEIIKKAELLIKNKKLRVEMSGNCIEEIKNGKFSIKERNRKLWKIYEEALR